MGKIRKRLVIFVFYDKDGLVDKYKEYYLQELSKNSVKILIVVNGKLRKSETKKLERYGEILWRENTGYDVTAYKETIERVGYATLSQYDELILCNDTVFGPLYPFLQVFQEMDSRKTDLWGITKGYADIVPLNGKIIEFNDHIHSYFIAIRKSLLRSDEFRRYWEKFPQISSYYDAVFKFEVRFTDYFVQRGCKYSTYVETDDIKLLTKNHLAFMTTDLLRDRKLPVIKRRHFYSNIDDFMGNTISNELRDSFDFVRQNTNYDTSMIWDTILRNGDLYSIWKQLTLTKILPVDYAPKKMSRVNLGVFVHIFRNDMVQFMRQKLSSLPSYAELHITTDTQEKKRVIEQVFSGSRFQDITVHVVKNRGRGEGALLVDMRKIVMKYEVACIMHDKSSPYEGASNYTISHGFSYKVYENMVKSKEYVNNVIRLFLENERLGIAMPPEPNHALYDSAFADLWTNPQNFNNTQSLLNMLGCSVLLSREQHPIFPVGGMFWCRPKALKKMLEHEWKFTDFPQEPIKTDGTILHAIERSYSYVAQDAGYYPMIIMNSNFAELEYENLKYNLQNVYADIRSYIKEYQPLGVKTLDKHLKDILRDNRKSLKAGRIALYPVRKLRAATRLLYHSVIRAKRRFL